MTSLTLLAAIYLGLAAIAVWVRCCSGENDLYIGAVTALLVWASVLVGVVFAVLYLVTQWA